MSSHRFFDFSGVDTVTPDNFEGISENSKVCPQYFTEEGIRAFRLVGGCCIVPIDSIFLVYRVGSFLDALWAICSGTSGYKKTM